MSRYEAWGIKQNANGLLESPPSAGGFTQTPLTNQGVSTAQVVGIGVAAQRIVSLGKPIFNTIIKTTGDKRLQKTVSRISRAIGFGTTVISLGLAGGLPGVALGVGIEAARLGVEVWQIDVQDGIDQTNQNYIAQKRGVAINKFVGTGERYD